MKTRIARLITVALCAVLLLGATLARPAQADQPVPFTFSEQYTIPLVDCGEGLAIYDEFTYKMEGRDWFEDDGTWIRYWFQVWGTDRLYTNDLEIQTKKYTWNGTVDYDTVKAQGTLFKVMLPGYGNIYHIVGQVIHDWDYNVLKITPKVETYFEGDYSTLCAFFAAQ